MGQRFSRRFEYFVSAQHALRIGRPETLCGFRIARGKFGMQVLDADLFEACAGSGANIVGDRRNVGQAFRQRMEIKPGAPGEDGKLAALTRFPKRIPRIGLITRDGIKLMHAHMSVEKMRRPRHVGVGRPRGQDACLAIDLHRIRVDDRAANALGERQRRRRLAARGRPCDKHRIHIRELARAVSGRFTHVLNVIGNDAETLAAKLRGFGEPEWLAPGHAFDIPVAGDIAAALNEARALAPEADVNAVAIANRRKKLLVADMDSTIIACECLDELADMAGLKPEVAAITERAMRGEIEFAGALRERVALLKGLDLSALERVHTERVKLNPGARTLLATMKAHGAKSLLVSGGFTFFTARVSAAAGFDSHQGNILLDDGAVLTGAVGEPILGREAKLKALEDAVAQLGISFDETLAVGDGANDLDMIERAGLGVAYHAKPVVAAAAGAGIAHTDLEGLLYLQGYRKEEFVG
jgi:phosphoserine phosphatase